MGTSVSQASPNTSGWKTVWICYAQGNIPIERTVTEIWRAAIKQDDNLFEQLGSRVVMECANAATRGISQESVVAKIEELKSMKENSVVGEFAKRALMITAADKYHTESLTTVLFRQLTAYLVSRDIPGFVGPDYRCKTLSELRTFKEQIANTVAIKVQSIERLEHLSTKTWHEAYPIVLEKLRQS